MGYQIAIGMSIRQQCAAACRLQHLIEGYKDAGSIT